MRLERSWYQTDVRNQGPRTKPLENGSKGPLWHDHLSTRGNNIYLIFPLSTISTIPQGCANYISMARMCASAVGSASHASRAAQQAASRATTAAAAAARHPSDAGSPSSIVTVAGRGTLPSLSGERCSAFLRNNPVMRLDGCLSRKKT